MIEIKKRRFKPLMRSYIILDYKLGSKCESFHVPVMSEVSAALPVPLAICLFAYIEKLMTTTLKTN